jgi:hypothetical protein
LYLAWVRFTTITRETTLTNLLSKFKISYVKWAPYQCAMAHPRIPMWNVASNMLKLSWKQEFFVSHNHYSLITRNMQVNSTIMKLWCYGIPYVVRKWDSLNVSSVRNNKEAYLHCSPGNVSLKFSRSVLHFLASRSRDDNLCE